jgi:hypothetical protein
LIDLFGYPCIVFSRIVVVVCISATQLLRRQFAITAVPVPNMGDSISEGTVLKFTKGKGEAVAVDEIVAVLETDKARVLHSWAACPSSLSSQSIYICR